MTNDPDPVTPQGTHPAPRIRQQSGRPVVIFQRHHEMSADSVVVPLEGHAAASMGVANPCRYSAAALALPAAVKMARLSPLNTSSHEAR